MFILARPNMITFRDVEIPLTCWPILPKAPFSVSVTGQQARFYGPNPERYSLIEFGGRISFEKSLIRSVFEETASEDFKLNADLHLVLIYLPTTCCVPRHDAFPISSC